MTAKKAEGSPAEILLIEDNPADADLMQEALEQCSIPNNLHVAKDGLEGLDFLYKRQKFADAPRPDLILLDLNLPRKDGREVLAEVKADENLRRIPILVLTTSQAEEDIVYSYDLHANCYLTKPKNVRELFSVMRRIEDFWFETVKLPPKG